MENYPSADRTVISGVGLAPRLAAIYFRKIDCRTCNFFNHVLL